MTTTLILTHQADAAHWGWTIAFFRWFIGLAGLGLFVNFWARSKTMLYLSAASAVAGSLLVVSHLGRIWNLPAAALTSLAAGRRNFGSWMLIGIVLLGILCIAAVVQSWLASKKESKVLESKALHLFNAALGVAATAYSGFLLTQAQGVPFWNTAVLPVLWIALGLACAIGALEILAASGRIGRLSGLGTTATAAHIAEAVILFAFVATAFSGTPGAAASAASLVSGDMSAMFWGGAAVLGIAVPLVLGLVKSPNVKALAGAAGIAGALFLRASVLFAGVFDPIVF